jgi:hypothetical protein
MLTEEKLNEIDVGCSCRKYHIRLAKEIGVLSFRFALFPRRKVREDENVTLDAKYL